MRWLTRWRPHRHRWERWSVSWREGTGMAWTEWGATWEECADCPAGWPDAGRIYRRLPSPRRVGFWL